MDVRVATGSARHGMLQRERETLAQDSSCGPESWTVHSSPTPHAHPLQLDECGHWLPADTPDTPYSAECTLENRNDFLTIPEARKEHN